MTTLLIEHAVTDFPTWQTAFERLADQRSKAGVTAERVLRPVDDPCYVVIALDFDAAEQAAAFLRFLTTSVWTNPGASPALKGAPRTAILEQA